MAEHGSPAGGSLLAVYKTLFLDLPLAGIRQVVEDEKKKEAVEMVWKNYDEGIRVATAALDNLYRDPYFGEALNHALQEMLRWQQLSGTITETFLAGLRLTTDLPTATEVRELLKELRTLSTYHAHRQTQEWEARDRQLSPPREESNVPVVRSSHPQKRKHLPTEFFDYFEPVDWNTAVLSDSARTQSSLTADFSEYFEPVNYPLASALSAEPQKRGSHITHIRARAKARAVKNLRLRQDAIATPVGVADANETQSVPA